MTSPPTVVLVNIWQLRGNSYADAWCELLRRAGATVRPLGRRNLRQAPHGPSTIVQLQWPEVTIRADRPAARLRKALSLARLVVRARLRGNRVLVTMHNVWPHDATVVDRAFWNLLPRVVTDVHALDAAGWPEIMRAHPALARARRHVIPHVNYASRLSTGPAPPRPAREGAPVALLYFGTIRPYKGIESLLDVVAAAQDRHSWRLRLVGRPQDEELAESITRTVRDESWAAADLQEQSDGELEAEVRAADLVVLPYRAVLNSGSVVLAMSAGTPVLVPDTPTFRSLGAQFGPGWVTTYDGALTAQHVDAALSAARDRVRLDWCDETTVASLIGSMLAAGTP